MRILKEPLLHFLLLGAALFIVNAWREKERSELPESTRINVSAVVIGRLRAGYERQFHRAPDEEELRGLVTAHIREEVLCREALAMGLDKNDTILRRRLAQKMEFLTDDLITADIDETALRAYFATNAARYANPERVSFRHVYFSNTRRGATAEAHAREALLGLKQGVAEDTLGDAFLHGYEFADHKIADIVATFGEEFAARIAKQPTGAWHGPIKSGYGMHLVKVDTRSAAKSGNFEMARAAVERDFTDERRRTANAEIFTRLRERYQISVDEAAITNALIVKLAEASK